MHHSNNWNYSVDEAVRNLDSFMIISNDAINGIHLQLFAQLADGYRSSVRFDGLV